MSRRRVTLATSLVVVVGIGVVALVGRARTPGTRSSELAQLRNQHQFPAPQVVDVQTVPCDQWVTMGHAELCAQRVVAISDPMASPTAVAFEVDLPNATMVVLQQTSTNETPLLAAHHPTHDVLHGQLPSNDALRAMSPDEFDAFRSFAEATWLTASGAKQIVVLDATTYSGVLFVHEQPLGRAWASATLWSKSGTSIDGVSFRPKPEAPFPDTDALVASLTAYRMK